MPDYVAWPSPGSGRCDRAHETLFRWSKNDIVESTQRYERDDLRTVHFPVTIPADGEAVVRYRVRYSR